NYGVKKYSPNGALLQTWNVSGTTGVLACPNNEGFASTSIIVYELLASGPISYAFGTAGPDIPVFRKEFVICAIGSDAFAVGDENFPRASCWLRDGTYLGDLEFSPPGGSGSGSMGVASDGDGGVYLLDSGGRVGHFIRVPVSATAVTWGRIKAGYR